VPNYDFITPRLATGGDLPGFAGSTPWVDELDTWITASITHVIDNRSEARDEARVAEAAPWIQYMHNGVDDDGARQPDEWFDTGVAFARAALADPEARLLIHCHMGINRGPSLTYAVLLDLGWDPVDALDAIRAARPIAGLRYAEDALDLHHRRTRASDHTRRSDHQRLRAWRRQHPIDVVGIIADIRARQVDHAA
jgi:dual specificity phosphatase 3